MTGDDLTSGLWCISAEVFAYGVKIHLLKVMAGAEKEWLTVG